MTTMSPAWWVFWAICWAMFGCIGGYIAERKGNDKAGAFLLSFFLGPIGLLIVALQKVRGDDAEDVNKPDFWHSRYGVTAAILAGVVVSTAGWWLLSSPDSPVNAADSASNSEELADSVKQSMQHMFDTDPEWLQYGLHVEEVTLIKASGNTYDGIATIRTRTGKQRDVSVDVTADSSNMMWQVASESDMLPLLTEHVTPGWGTP